VDTVTGYVDAAHDNCLKTRQYVGAYIFTLNGGAIAYRAKWIIIICTSSTEAEFITTVSADKAAKYLRSILLERGFPQPKPTVIYEDNADAVMIANDGRPTELSHHIDIQLCSLQKVVKEGHVTLSHVRGTINPYDALTL
jgi:hypothetical protein